MPLVIDLSSLNKFIVNEHFQPGDVMTNIDLKDTFLSLFTSLTQSFFSSFVTSSKLFHLAPSIFTNVFHTCRRIPEEKGHLTHYLVLAAAMEEAVKNILCW